MCSGNTDFLLFCVSLWTRRHSNTTLSKHKSPNTQAFESTLSFLRRHNLSNRQDDCEAAKQDKFQVFCVLVCESWDTGQSHWIQVDFIYTRQGSSSPILMSYLLSHCGLLLSLKFRRKKKHPVVHCTFKFPPVFLQYFLCQFPACLCVSTIMGLLASAGFCGVRADS